MFIYLGFYKRKPGLSWEEFSRHWSEVHGPLLRDTPEFSRYIKRYVQHHLQPNPAPGAQALEFDGFSEVWFESPEDRRKMWEQPLFKELMIPDEELFLDLSATRYSMTDNPIIQIAGSPEWVIPDFNK